LGVPMLFATVARAALGHCTYSKGTYAHAD